ncbi:hypothetical protein ACFW34_12035 [Streptomyces sp. NPDC058848]|uniref:hypothetical protein n=1 Tax=unclassified Streptomyces TaxID=2593676 RepID=UPI0036BD70DE
MSQPQPPRWQPPQQPITWGTTPQHGPQQPPQPPQWGAPPPPPRPPKPKNKAAKVLGIIAICVVGFFVVSLTIGAIVGEDEPAKEKAPAAKPPAYTVVEQEVEGNRRIVVVEVDSTKNLRAVFDAVTKDLTDEAGYFVEINCSTGGTDKVDNRLANGRYAVGRMGSAATGLDEGGSDFSTNEGRSCPAM